MIWMYLIEIDEQRYQVVISRELDGTVGRVFCLRCQYTICSDLERLAVVAEACRKHTAKHAEKPVRAPAYANG